MIRKQGYMGSGFSGIQDEDSTDGIYSMFQLMLL